ncbi:MAG: beta-N-acetylhexosaminidase, partial [Victivallales bacterium]|nr:beta-N-acetylhexosaminidase [Victivallales bacterium]
MKKILCGVIFASATGIMANPINDFTSRNGYPLLIPSVQKLTPADGKFVLPKNFTVAAPAGAAYELELIGRALKNRFPKYSVSGAKDGICRLVLTSDSVPASPEGYTLKVGREKIEIKAKDPRGLYYGVQTLCNMIRNIASPELPGVFIEDWPDLKLRGIYMRLRFYNSGEAAHFLKVIEAYGALKYNTLYLEFADNFPYKNNPFTRRGYTLSKNDVSEIVRVAEANKMKIVPVLQVLSHDSWLKTHPKYESDISEGKPDFPWASASCPCRPLPRKLNLMAINEQIDFFKPERFNICLDEISQCPWGVCSICKTKNMDKVWEEQTLFYTGEVLKRGVVPIISFDSFYPGNAVHGENVLPKLDPRVVVGNWDYNEKIRMDRFDFFKKYKFPIIGKSYCLRLNNTMAMPLAVKKEGLEGVVLTLWHYLWKFTEMTKMAPEALAGVVTAGDFQWKCREFPVAALTYDPAYQAVRLFVPDEALEPRPGTEMVSIPLEKAVNTALGKDEDFPLLDKAMIENLRKELAARTEKFRLITSGDNYYAAVLSGGNDEYPAAEIMIPVGRKVNALSFLLATSCPTDVPSEQARFTPIIGRMTVVRADGSKSEVDLRYRCSVNFWSATASGVSCRFVSRFNDERNALCGFFALDWRNPRPDIAIKEIRFAGRQKNGIAPALFAISASGGDTRGAGAQVAVPVVLPLAAHRNSAEKTEISGHETILAGFDSGMG